MSRWAVLVLAAACSGGPGLDARPANPTCRAPARPRSPVEVVPAFPQLAFEQPVAMTQSADGAWWYVIERAGRVWRFAADPAVRERELVLDLSDVVADDGDCGLVGIALHPESGELFLSYTRPGATTLLDSRIARFRSTDGGATFDSASERVVLSIPQSINIHVNADLHFGPDGYLYIGFGDGTDVGAPGSPAGDPGRLPGKILRLDVDGAEPYAIPSDNPFANGGGAPEVFAYGLRNPWRMTFDRATGDLWAGDVGWATWEEIDRIVPGGNYGWNTYEAVACLEADRCDQPGLIEPVLAMPHDESRSITVGYVYRGAAIPALQGRLVFGDFIYGYLWSIDPDAPVPQVINADGRAITSFAEDRDGELYVVDLGGAIWRLVPGDDASAPTDVPATLSATGCFEADGKPAAGLIPYALNWPFYSDGAEKHRWMAVPDGTTVDVDAEGKLVFPIGSVLAKEFSLAGRRVETRLLVRHDDGDWAGYTYVWREDASDADLITQSAAPVRDWGGQLWAYPRRTECLGCHTQAVGRAIGPSLAQLDRDFTYPGDHDANQLATLAHIGVLEAPLPESRALPGIGDSDAPLDDRARAWLHANCASCHRPGVMGNGSVDLRYATPLAETGTCDVRPNQGELGITRPRIIAPGQPERSVLLARIRDPGPTNMPPGAGFLIDDAGVALIEAWILSLRDCD